LLLGTAILDRILHHPATITINGKSEGKGKREGEGEAEIFSADKRHISRFDNTCPRHYLAKGISMKKATLLSVSFFVLVSFVAGQNWFKGTLEEAVAKAKNEKKLVLVDFYSGG